MDTYTIFIQVYPEKDSELVRERINTFITKYSAKRLSLISFELSSQKENEIRLWNDVQRMAEDDLCAVLLSHRILGIGVCPEHLQAVLSKLPKNDLESLRELIAKELRTIS